MNTDLLFWMLIILITIELLAILIISNAIQTLLKSDFFKKKLKTFHEKEKSKGNGVGFTVLLVGLFSQLSTNSFATSVVEEVTPAVASSSQSNVVIYALLAVSIILLLVILYLKKMMSNLFNIDKEEEVAAVTESKIKESKILKILTDRVAEEDEASIDMGHDYDGIRELDNNLPPWWKWGFYISIVIGVFYFMHYHVFNTGTLPIEAYHNEMAQAELDVEQYLKDQAMNVDESSVTLMTDQSELNKGKKLFTNYCSVCHSDNGGGGVGPNLTDEYWIHGGSIKDVFKTIKYGAKNGMKSWKDELNPIQMQQVGSYIKSLNGTNPEGAKAAEGEKYIPEVVVDTNSVIL